MKKIEYSRDFKKDLKRLIKRREPLLKLDMIVTMLQNDEILPERCRPHKLSGTYQGFWDCHIEPDWILIYQVDDKTLALYRTGTHADLFK